jgi:hypothetical protein
MKPAYAIISHIQSLPQFKKLKKHYCYKKFVASLAPKFQKAIAFVYVRDQTLFIALSHPGFKMELHYSKDLFRDVLNFLTQVDTKCQALKVSKVVLFNSKQLSITKERKIVSTVPHYKERSLGDFEIKSQDKDIINIFEKIRNSIKSNRK